MKNRSRTTRVVPGGQPACSWERTCPPSKTRLVPRVAPWGQVNSSTRATAAMAARASPRKPKVPMASKSWAARSLLVAWRRKAVWHWPSGMPQPLSVTRIRAIPPRWISTVRLVAPASMAFSHSSFTTEAGRSTTSPAAMRSATWGSNTWMSAMGVPPIC